MIHGNTVYEPRTATVLETRMGRFDVAIALSILLLLLTFAVNFVLTRIQQREQIRWPRRF